MSKLRILNAEGGKKPGFSRLQRYLDSTGTDVGRESFHEVDSLRPRRSAARGAQEVAETRKNEARSLSSCP